jgi:hypothetical protein
MDDTGFSSVMGKMYVLTTWQDPVTGVPKCVAEPSGAREVANVKSKAAVNDTLNANVGN